MIYGFGKHENVTVEFGTGMNVIYGLNEAGKTTIQQFILHVLFGFPQRNSSMLRYEPKSGGKYGGQVHLVDNEYGRCTVERVRGKSSGDVTVYFENGTSGGEEALKKLLRHYDRTSFESIFSFSLLQLQGFEKMDEDELSRTLLASGTTGVDSLLELEKQMEKEMGDYFKKSGRNPAMNVKVTELRSLELELKEEQEKIEEYAPSIKRIHQIEEQLAILLEKKKMQQEQLRQLSLLQQLLPLQKDKEMLELEINNIGDTPFPADGIRRFESLSGKLIETKAAKQRIGEELAQMEVRFPKQHEPDRLVAIEALLAKESEWHDWRSSLTALDDELRRLNGLKSRIFDRLGVREQEVASVLFEADVSIQKEEEMHGLIKDMDDVNNQISLLENQLTSVEKELKEAKLKYDSIEAPSEQEIKKAEAWPAIRQRLAEAHAYVSFGREAKNTVKTLPIIMFVLALVLIGVGIIQNELFVIFIGIIIGGIGGVLYLKKGTDDHSKLQEMQSYLAKHDGLEHEMEGLLAKIESYNRNLAWLEEVIKGLEQNIESIGLEHDKLDIQSRQTESVFDEFVQQYGFDGLPSPGIVPELFRMIRDVQEVKRDIDEVTNRKRIKEQNLAMRKEEAESVLQQFASPDIMYELLRKEFSRLNEESERIKSITAGLELLEPELKETVALLDIQEKSLRALMDEANAETEEDFYSAYDVHQDVQRLTEKLAAIETQISASHTQHFVIQTTETELNGKVAESEAEIITLDDEANHLIHEKAALLNKTEKLLTDESHSEKLQLFEMKKAELAELAKKWSVRKAVSEAIRQTMLELKEKTLPDVLQRAVGMFSELTGGKYESLMVNEEGVFEAVSTNGMRYPIVELSQATKEQAYISLRLALAESVYRTAPFPIIMDDPFVHFDGERLSRMIKLLSASHQHQFIYFTCHKKMKDKWVSGTIINVSDIGNEQGAFVR